MNDETTAQVQDPPPLKPLMVNPHHSADQHGIYRGIFQSAGITAPPPPSPDAHLRLTFDVVPESAEELEWLISETGEDAGELFQKAITLLKYAREAIKAGQVVGAASSADKLDVEFTEI
jgi:hypothetical protein